MTNKIHHMIDVKLDLAHLVPSFVLSVEYEEKIGI